MNDESGFTLIEILVALAVFAILATITSSIMYYAFDTKARLNEQTERLSTLQLAVAIVEQDTRQIVKRAIYRGHEMQRYSAFIGESQYLEFTRSGMINSGNQERQSILQRVALLCRNNQLVRRSWQLLDPVNEKLYQDKILINELLTCQFDYLNNNLQVLPEWRPNTLQQRVEPLPKAIRLSMTLKNKEKMYLLFIIAEGLYS